ncbi:hypothetical protein P175DRAFT_0512093 [Aspergillus ochraceoroseus IBT 24754]|uniref:non-specific serine/threonine protein kinase n=1 Tax=Aspergillus ochraceoroseus IBT 24754 TaxID=1392256 RepID=A0A2T5LNP0_9EURO|nr:uncharacterized protein P175DRAFT_0512093 [Aspergillus ochraceoroseus IBT 24754]PTU17900.1 hypothetical protein P175DRAFT_0512093 [Aspergillus ochraceoroseus IBT 24754]
MISRRGISSWSIPQLPTTCNFASFSRPRIDQFRHTTTVDAEPLHRYRKGGDHPIALGSFLRDKRYKILPKLDGGGYSTAYGAVKICISARENSEANRELHVIKRLASIHPCPQHVVRLLDDFDLSGPNGTHQCLVFELLGPSFLARPPKPFAKQALGGLDTLHQHNIGHGDIHPRNLALTVPCMNNMPEEQFMEMLGKPEIGASLEPGVPNYIVRPASYCSLPWPSSMSIKLTTIRQTLHTPLPVRAPEVIFEEPLDYRVDLWSMGFFLSFFVGQPPFDSFMLIKRKRWQDSCRTADDESAAEIPGPALQEWLEDMYFDGARNEDLTKDDIVSRPPGSQRGKF